MKQASCRDKKASIFVVVVHKIKMTTLKSAHGYECHSNLKGQKILLVFVGILFSLQEAIEEEGQEFLDIVAIRQSVFFQAMKKRESRKMKRTQMLLFRL